MVPFCKIINVGPILMIGWPFRSDPIKYRHEKFGHLIPSRNVDSSGLRVLERTLEKEGITQQKWHQENGYEVRSTDQRNDDDPVKILYTLSNLIARSWYAWLWPWQAVINGDGQALARFNGNAFTRHHHQKHITMQLQFAFSLWRLPDARRPPKLAEASRQQPTSQREIRRIHRRMQKKNSSRKR